MCNRHPLGSANFPGEGTSLSDLVKEIGDTLLPTAFLGYCTDAPVSAATCSNRALRCSQSGITLLNNA